MSCLMHHKFILIDAVAKERGNKSGGGDDSDSSSDDEDEEVSGGAISCDKCALMMASKSVSGGGGNVPTKQCVLCRPLRIRSKEDLIKFPSETLPRLPKHGLLITGSHNWSQQVRKERER